jgi:hypothetical protein
MQPQVPGATSVNTYLQADQANQPPTNTPQATPTGNQPSWWEKLLPTLGGIAGGLGAGAADIVTGGAAIPFDAAIAGAGGALGKVGENALTDKSLGSGVVASGLENGVGQLAGGVLGKVAGGVLGKTAQVSGKAAEDALMNQAPGLLDRPTAAYLIKNNITDLSKIGDVAPTITGQAGGEGAVIPNATLNAVNNATDKVSINSTLTKVGDSLQNSVMKPSTQKNVLDALQSSMENMTKDSGGDVTKLPQFGASGKPLKDTLSVFSDSGQMNDMTRGAVYKQAQLFKSAAYKLEGGAAKTQFGEIADPQVAATINSFKTWGNELESNALGLGPTDTPLAVTPQDKSDMIKGLSSLQQSQPQLYKSLTDDISSSDNWKSVKTATKPIVDASKANEVVQGNLNAQPGTTPLQAGSGGAKGLVKSVLTSPTASKVESGTMKTLSKVTGKAAASKMLPVLARAGTIAAANLPNDAGSPTGSINGTIAGGANMQPNIQSILQSSPLMQSYQVAQAGAGITPQDAALIQSLAPQAQKLQTAAPIIQQLLSGYGTAGGAQGMGGGILSKLSGLLPGTAANQYNAEGGSAAATLAQLLGISPEAAAGLIPQLTAGPQAAAPQVQNLQSIFGNMGG